MIKKINGIGFCLFLICLVFLVGCKNEEYEKPFCNKTTYKSCLDCKGYQCYYNITIDEVSCKDIFDKCSIIIVETNPDWVNMTISGEDNFNITNGTLYLHSKT